MYSLNVESDLTLSMQIWSLSGTAALNVDLRQIRHVFIVKDRKKYNSVYLTLFPSASLSATVTGS